MARTRDAYLLLVAAAAVARPAREKHASLVVSLKKPGDGSFGQTNASSTQVHVFARSTWQAQYSSSPNLYAPAFGTAAPGALFNLTVAGLTSSTKQPVNGYQLELDWNDTTHQ